MVVEHIIEDIFRDVYGIGVTTIQKDFKSFVLIVVWQKVFMDIVHIRIGVVTYNIILDLRVKICARKHRPEIQ